jgi:hypothetical protein
VSDQSNIARRRAAGRRDGGPAYQARRAEISRTAARVFQQMRRVIRDWEQVLVDIVLDGLRPAT